MRIIAKRGDESYLLVEDNANADDPMCHGVVVSEGEAIAVFVGSALARGYWEKASGRGDYLLRGKTIRPMAKSDMLRTRG